MGFADTLFQTVKSIGKIILQSRRSSTLNHRADGKRIIVMGNGPSLADTITQHLTTLQSTPTMAVNFAAIAPEFEALRPRYYVLADPYFFSDAQDANLQRLRERLSDVNWQMTLLVPVAMHKRAKELYHSADIATFNAVGIEGFSSFCHAAYSAGLGMPRPRNVLIPSIMLAIELGFKEIVIVGADHSWMKTLAVTDENEVVSIQPHFYDDGEDEKQRVRHEYRNYRLHQIVESFAVAFRSYHQIAAYAATQNVTIYNATKDSFIDAFPRRQLSEI